MISKFNFFSFGYASEDIEEDSHYVEVYPLEILPDIEGDPNEDMTIEDETKNIDDGDISIKVDVSYTIRCKWLPLGESNRLTAPTVTKGTHVHIFRYGNTDKYYWTPMYNELDIRKQEKMIIALSNKSSINDSNDQLYYMLWDTINKKVRLHTDDRDGEYTTYDIELDTKKGQFTFTDGKGNEIFLDSKKDIYRTTINKQIINETVNKTENIKDTHKINLSKFAVDRGSDELITLLLELIQAHMNESHVGNLGIPTSLTDESYAVYEDLHARLSKFKV